MVQNWTQIISQLVHNGTGEMGLRAVAFKRPRELEEEDEVECSASVRASDGVRWIRSGGVATGAGAGHA
jgi:hypothetical protein